MKTKIYKLLLNAKQGFLALVFTAFSFTAYSQAVYSFSFTGSVQTLTLPAGPWGIQCWGANGGSINLAGGEGKGGYSIGEFSVVSPGTQLNILVGSKGFTATGTTSSAGAGGWNGGGGGAAVGRSGAGGGGATDVRVGGISAGNRIIVAGGGGGAAYYGSSLTSASVAPGGNGGAQMGQNGAIIASSGQITPGGGGAGANGAAPGLATVGTSNGTATGGGGGGNCASGASVGQPGTGGGAGGLHGGPGSGSTGSAGGGGGGFAGGAGGVQTNNAGVAGGGGSGYIGGVTSGTTVGFGQSGFVANPDLNGNGYVIITDLCDINLISSGNNSLLPTICAGQSLTLTTSAIGNYSWSTGATTSSIVVSPLTNTVYNLSALSASNNCTTSRSITVIVSGGLPVLSIANPSNNICTGRTVSLTASGALTYTWTGGVVNGQPFTPNATANYTVTGENGCGITTATTSIIVSPLPVSSVANPTLVCEGYTSTLTAVSGVGGYTWQPGSQTGPTVLVAPLANTIYTVTASDGTCSGTSTVEVQTKTTPVISVVATSTNLCEGESVTLTASGVGPGGTYTWTPGGSNGNTLTASPLMSTLYTVNGTNTLSCESFAQIPVVIQQAPQLQITASSTMVCLGNSMTLTASGANVYNWVGGPSNASNVVSPTGPTVYTVTGTHQTNTCVATRTIAVSAVIPNVTVPSAISICEGSSGTITASGATSYSFNGVNSGANGTFVVAPMSTTNYVLIAVTQNTVGTFLNCPTTHSILVTVNSNPTITVVPTKSLICRGQTHTLTASGAATYSWSNSPATGSVITITPSVTTLYTVTGTDANGCVHSITSQALVSGCNSIADNAKQYQSVSVFPNPSNGAFTVKVETDITLKLINNLGQEIQTISLNSDNQFTTEINNLSSGIYFLVGENENGMVNQKVMITK